jgi:hypothetical protein
MAFWRQYNRRILVGALVVALGLLDMLLLVGSQQGGGSGQQRQEELAEIARLEERIREERASLEDLAFPEVSEVRNLVLNLVQGEGETQGVQVAGFSTVDRSEVLAGTTFHVLQNVIELKGSLRGLLSVLDRLFNAQANTITVGSLQGRRVQDLWSLKLIVKVYAGES